VRLCVAGCRPKKLQLLLTNAQGKRNHHSNGLLEFGMCWDLRAWVCAADGSFCRSVVEEDGFIFFRKLSMWSLMSACPAFSAS
jgi:hypothetical protein